MTALMVPAYPLRRWLLAWAITTRDTSELIARGFDLDATFVVDLLGSEPPRMLDAAVAREVCRKLRIDPPELWRSDIARLVGPCNWPAEALWADVGSHLARFAGRL